MLISSLLHFSFLFPYYPIFLPLPILHCTDDMIGGDEESEIGRLPIDLLALLFSLITCFKDLAQVSRVCRRWKQGVEESLARRESLSFYNSLRSTCLCPQRARHITDYGLQISTAKCIGNLSSISLWGLTAISDTGVIQLISGATYLQYLNIGGTFITDASLFAIADSCPQLKTIVLWGCRQVTEKGLFVLVNKCCKLESINVWGMRVPLHFLIALLTMSPALRIQPRGVLLNDDNSRTWPIY